MLEESVAGLRLVCDTAALRLNQDTTDLDGPSMVQHKLPVPAEGVTQGPGGFVLQFLQFFSYISFTTLLPRRGDIGSAVRATTGAMNNAPGLPSRNFSRRRCEESQFTSELVRGSLRRLLQTGNVHFDQTDGSKPFSV